MAHQLWPSRGSRFLPPEEVIRRLRAAFPNVHVDQQRGMAEVEAQLVHMRRIAGPGQPFSAADVDRKHRYRSRAVHVTILDDDAMVETVIEVDEALLFSYSSEAQEQAVAPLIERVAAVLGYDCETV